jgi:preprotein translocase subunit SecE
VAGVSNLGKGSKRKVRLVRWSRSEKLSMIVLFVVVVIETVVIALWLINHPFD